MIAPLLIGFAFGWTLQRTELSKYERIVGVFRFRDLTVLRFLLTALVTASVGIGLLRAFGLAVAVPIPATYVSGNLVGGAIFGVGMALSGFCPGTVAAGAGEGRLDNLVPGVLGLLTGAVVYGLSYEKIMPRLATSLRLGEVTIPALLHVEPWLVVIVFAEVAILIFALTRRG